MKVKFIYLLFPNSSDKKYKLFINDANQCHIVIPADLYKDVRKIDIEYFLDCLQGNKIITEFMLSNNTEKYDFKKISKLSQALCSNYDLNFIKLLDEKFPPI